MLSLGNNVWCDLAHLETVRYAASGGKAQLTFTSGQVVEIGYELPVFWLLKKLLPPSFTVVGGPGGLASEASDCKVRLPVHKRKKKKPV